MLATLELGGLVLDAHMSQSAPNQWAYINTSSLAFGPYTCFTILNRVVCSKKQKMSMKSDVQAQRGAGVNISEFQEHLLDSQGRTLPRAENGKFYLF